MAYVFEGTFVLRLDAKGRLCLPTAIRDGFATDGALEVTRHPDGCLILYPTDAWREVRARLAALPYAARGLQRIVLGGATQVALDSHSRLQISASLRNLAHLEREVILIGLGNRLELWDRAAYEANETEAMAREPAQEVQAFTF